MNIDKVVEVGLEKAEEEDTAGKDEDGDWLGASTIEVELSEDLSLTDSHQNKSH